MNLIDMNGSAAVVTGGSSGIGLATVELLLQSGAAVAFCGRDEKRLRDAEARLRERFLQARLGLPAEAARAIFFLATPPSSYTTGSHIDVSEGLSHHA